MTRTLNKQRKCSFTLIMNENSFLFRTNWASLMPYFGENNILWKISFMMDNLSSIHIAENPPDYNTVSCNIFKRNNFNYFSKYF